jgi:hypothetical protein
MAFIIAAGSLSDNDGFGSVSLNDGIKAIGYRVQRFVPGNSLPSVSVFFHGIKDPIRMISQLCHRKSFAAQGTIAEWGIRVPFHLYHPVVLYMSDDTASAVTIAADGSNLFCVLHITLLYRGIKPEGQMYRALKISADQGEPSVCDLVDF